MKKLARLTALLLTGALLLVLTACGAETEQQAKQRLLDEINSYRASIHLDQLKEVEQLSAAEQVWAEQFRAVGKTELPDSETHKAYKRWRSMTEDWRNVMISAGVGMQMRIAIFCLPRFQPTPRRARQSCGQP